jgi:hypothetical protein
MSFDGANLIYRRGIEFFVFQMATSIPFNTRADDSPGDYQYKKAHLGKEPLQSAK